MLVTSGDFTTGARDEAADVTKHNALNLINGRALAELMMAHNIGVETKALETHDLNLGILTREYLQELAELPEPDDAT